GASVGGATLALASIEYLHVFTDILGRCVFFDAGDVSDSFGDMHMKLGYGVGGVVRTPAGPIELNLAYGQQEHDLRLHFSLGIAF
ncbi:BamA/TamA family outer membrane protein, partial [Kerstersia sp.]|uniref:BamA/TamA family outer membrane protein n=1 Tax=Kerstersia sp. TaxID=1930783 RepID=UPI003F92F0F2